MYTGNLQVLNTRPSSDIVQYTVDQQQLNNTIIVTF